MYVNKDDLNALLLCSFRYAMNRQSYMPNMIQELILKYGKVLHPFTLGAMSNDLRNLDNPMYSWSETKEFIREKLNAE